MSIDMHYLKELPKQRWRIYFRKAASIRNSANRLDKYHKDKRVIYHHITADDKLAEINYYERGRYYGDSFRNACPHPVAQPICSLDGIDGYMCSICYKRLED